MSLSLCLNPIYLMLTCAVCCSYAFMLPVATAPNAIVFSHSTMKTSGNIAMHPSLPQKNMYII
jgi:sodium-dependent dicarboxylate transporter 2/3/5